MLNKFRNDLLYMMDSKCARIYINTRDLIKALKGTLFSLDDVELARFYNEEYAKVGVKMPTFYFDNVEQARITIYDLIDRLNKYKEN